MKAILKALIATVAYESEWRTFEGKNLILWLPFPWNYFKDKLLLEKLRERYLT